jgi:hypothetical protein
VTITGPFDAQGATDTPSRRRVFVCRPANPAAEAGCARQIVSSLARRAYRRPVTDAETGVLLKFYDAGRAKSGFDAGIEMALRRLLVSPEFLFRVESDPSGVAPNAAYPIRDSRSSCGAAFQTTSCSMRP